MLTAHDIKNYNLFIGLDEPELAGIAALCTRETYKSGSVIFSPNNPSDNIFLLEGDNDAIQIEVAITGEEDRIVVHTLSKGETFGWAVLEPHQIRTSIARCLDEVTVICINGASLVQLLNENNHTGYIVMRNLAGVINKRLTYTTIAFRHHIRKLREKMKAPVA
jgi:CRP/FNR family transcriptional regulator, cyclic AMP receptor protein